MDTDLETLATALYVTADDLLKAHPEITPPRPRVGIVPSITDAEVLTLAAIAPLVGIDTDRRFLRYARKHLRGMFPYIPGQSGYNKRLRALAGTIGWLAAVLATTTSVYTDDVHLVDSTPIECARSRPTVRRSNLAGWAGYGYCASHSRFFWGLRLHLIATPTGLPVAWALTSPSQDEREVLRSMLEHLAPTGARTIIADKGYRSKDLEDDLNQAGLTLLRPAARNEAPRPGAGLLRPLRQRIESVFDTLKDQLGLERHNGRTPTGVTARVAQRILALTAAIWHNDNTGNPQLRSLTPYDH
ncbi:IS982 family transposase [Actinomyces sp. ZJ308]|uniref:IS982 family transposase n=1 Tax=Actinomyces sp. ZJ308 TaxID=2708342 RepID=UPI001423558A|nr:IS982 family transposase [Actinomyces sp. ZJ308]